MAGQITETCFSILGGSTYLEDSRHNKIANDLKGFNWWEGTNEMLAFHVTISGIAHATKEMQVIALLFKEQNIFECSDPLLPIIKYNLMIPHCRN